MTRRLLARAVAHLPDRVQEALAGWVWQRYVNAAMREQRRATAEDTRYDRGELLPDCGCGVPGCVWGHGA